MSEYRTPSEMSESLAANATANLRLGTDNPYASMARTTLLTAIAQATLAQVMETRLLRECLEERLPDHWDSYGDDL